MFSSVDETGLTKVSESLSAGSVHIKDGLDNIGLSKKYSKHNNSDNNNI